MRHLCQEWDGDLDHEGRMTDVKEKTVTSPASDGPEPTSGLTPAELRFLDDPGEARGHAPRALPDDAPMGPPPSGPAGVSPPTGAPGVSADAVNEQPPRNPEDE